MVLWRIKKGWDKENDIPIKHPTYIIIFISSIYKLIYKNIRQNTNYNHTYSIPIILISFIDISNQKEKLIIEKSQYYKEMR